MMKIIISVAIYLASTNAAFACSCISAKFEDKLEDAQRVYAGYFTSAKVLENKDKLETFAEIEAELKVVEVFKGKVVKKLKVTTPLNSASCGMPITLGRKYLIVLNDNNYNDSSVGLCSGSGKFPRYYEDEYRPILEQLKEPKQALKKEANNKNGAS